jgi:hypothetical protein
MARDIWRVDMRSLALAVLVILGLGVATPVYADEPGQNDQMQQGEEGGGRSGFWTSRRPAKGGAYRWRLLGIGVGLASLTGFGILVLIRRANIDRDRTARALGDHTRG